MKRFTFPILFTLVLIMTVFVSCKKDSTAKANQQYVGTYSGSISFAQVAGSFSDSATLPFTYKITAGSTDNAIVISTLPVTGAVNATVSGNVVTIATQTYTDSTGTSQLHGTGAIAGNNLTLNYITTAGDTTTTIVFVGTK